MFSESEGYTVSGMAPLANSTAEPLADEESDTISARRLASTSSAVLYPRSDSRFMNDERYLF